MDDFRILTNRKRAIIALVHTVVFMLIAMVQLGMGRPTPGLLFHGPAPVSSIVLAGIYSIVTCVLLVLLGFSRGARERIYFGFCSSSAGFGLLRAIMGDPPLHVAQYVRVLALMCAVVMGTVIVRVHSVEVLAE